MDCVYITIIMISFCLIIYLVELEGGGVGGERDAVHLIKLNIYICDHVMMFIDKSRGGNERWVELFTC